ncbi:hypothetical protein B1400_1530 [Bifidobacterium italicum]|uniref:Uncharacterized protein n=2 Tax=Bifidobacterium italicum TaxID=1960968 RepID=A0A2A2EFT6_9BIFI|nr:hypothetical protein B1400_1530 [Bifidobacterium italicum]
MERTMVKEPMMSADIPKQFPALIRRICANKAFSVLHVPMPAIVLVGALDVPRMRETTRRAADLFIEYGVQDSVNPDQSVFVTPRLRETSDVEWREMTRAVDAAAAYTNRYDGTIGVDLRFLDDSIDEELVGQVASKLNEWTADARVVAFVGSPESLVPDALAKAAHPRRICRLDIADEVEHVRALYAQMMEDALHRLERAAGPLSDAMRERFDECVAERSGYGNLPRTAHELRILADAAIVDCLEPTDDDALSIGEHMGE